MASGKVPDIHLRQTSNIVDPENERKSTYEFTLLAGLPLGVLQTLLVTADSNNAGLLLERVADSAGADLSVLQVAV